MTHVETQALLDQYVAPLKRRIHILGSTGSGKTHIARSLSSQLGIPAFDLDEIFWDNASAAYGTPAAADVRDRRLTEIVGKDAWIIEGVYQKWLGPSFDRADIYFGTIGFVPTNFKLQRSFP